VTTAFDLYVSILQDVVSWSSKHELHRH